MKVLMFGWEFPPNISGGLGTACYGLTKSLSNLQNMKITFVIPKVHGNESKSNVELIGANQIELIKSKIRKERLKFPLECYSVESQLVPYIDPLVYNKENTLNVESIGTETVKTKAKNIKFTGEYGRGLLSEIHNFSVVSEYISSQTDYDLIHAHDWLTFPAGISAKKVSGKPLIIHVHATDFDRGGGKANPVVYKIEKEGMEQADCIVCVSNRTRDLIIKRYNITPRKIFTVHNGVDFKDTHSLGIKKDKSSENIVTFLARITLQKGPEYFIKVAELVLSKMNNVKFVMAGSGELYHKMIRIAAQAGISDRFFFTGFLKGCDVQHLLNLSDVFVMPSVSEPFGIGPLEAMNHGVPTIISKQSGVSEVINHTIKVDYWDVYAMADAIHAILSYPSLKRTMSGFGQHEAYDVKWENAATKLKDIYNRLLRA